MLEREGACAWSASACSASPPERSGRSTKYNVSILNINYTPSAAAEVARCPVAFMALVEDTDASNAQERLAGASRCKCKIYVCMSMCMHYHYYMRVTPRRPRWCEQDHCFYYAKVPLFACRYVVKYRKSASLMRAGPLYYYMPTQDYAVLV